MVDSSFYNEDYYQRGLETGKSCYQLYRWLPEMTMPMAMRIIDYLHIHPEHTILDYGCAFGYLVKAFRLLNRQAWGVDISAYAIENIDMEVKPYCAIDHQAKETMPKLFDFCIAKDVFEHIEYNKIDNILRDIPAKNLLSIIPLGDNGKYISPCNNMDKSHIICENVNWWIDKFKDCGWELVDFTYKIDGIKESYYTLHPTSHGFFYVMQKAFIKERIINESMFDSSSAS